MFPRIDTKLLHFDPSMRHLCQGGFSSTGVLYRSQGQGYILKQVHALHQLVRCCAGWWVLHWLLTLTGCLRGVKGDENCLYLLLLFFCVHTKKYI